MTVAVVTDTTHYLPPALLADLGVREVSLYVGWDGGLRRESEITDLGAFYDDLRTAATVPATSQPSVGDVLAVYEPLLAEGRDIVSIHLSAGLSGTMASAQQARAATAAPERLEVLDSETGCGGLGLAVLAAARAREGLRRWFCVDTLEYLRRGGRVGAAQSWIGAHVGPGLLGVGGVARDLVRA
jgi:DegV family protein with EDD domain